MKYYQYVILIIFFFQISCSSTSTFLDEDNKQTGLNTIPMYGGAVKSPELINVDNQFIETTMKEFKDRQSASVYFCNKGWEFIGSKYLYIAMKRFNQAWLLDSTYYGVYWGFAVVVSERDKDYPESVRYFAYANSKMPDDPNLLSDYGKAISLYATFQNPKFTNEQKEKFYNSSDSLYAKAIELNPKMKHKYYEKWLESIVFSFGRKKKLNEVYLKSKEEEVEINSMLNSMIQGILGTK